MPILNGHYAGEIQQPDGTKIPAQPSAALILQGPVVQISFGLSRALASQLTAQGSTLPNPVSGWGLIDTGAGCTCVDNTLAQQMGLPVIDVVQMTSASHASTPANIYPIHLELVGSPIQVDVPRAMGASLSAQGLVALLGRDFLQFCTLFYNGPGGHITLAI